MPLPLEILLPLAIQDAPAEAPPAAPNLWLWMAGLFAIFYFLMIRPQMREQKRRREMLGGLKKNDRVVTSGGMYGTITAIDDQEVTLRVDEGSNTKIRFTRAAIAGLANAAEPAADKKT